MFTVAVLDVKVGALGDKVGALDVKVGALQDKMDRQEKELSSMPI